MGRRFKRLDFRDGPMPYCSVKATHHGASLMRPYTAYCCRACLHALGMNTLKLLKPSLGGGIPELRRSVLSASSLSSEKLELNPKATACIPGPSISVLDVMRGGWSTSSDPIRAPTGSFQALVCWMAHGRGKMRPVFCPCTTEEAIHALSAPVPDIA